MAVAPDRTTATPPITSATVANNEAMTRLNPATPLGVLPMDLVDTENP
jgi:hypothetical protein